MTKRNLARVGKISKGEFDYLEAHHVIFDSSLQAPQKLILLAILDHWKRSSPKPWVGIRTLSKETSLVKECIHTHISSMVRDGILDDPFTRRPDGSTWIGKKSCYNIEAAVFALASGVCGTPKRRRAKSVLSHRTLRGGGIGGGSVLSHRTVVSYPIGQKEQNHRPDPEPDTLRQDNTDTGPIGPPPENPIAGIDQGLEPRENGRMTNRVRNYNKISYLSLPPEIEDDKDLPDHIPWSDQPPDSSKVESLATSL